MKKNKTVCFMIDDGEYLLEFNSLLNKSVHTHTYVKLLFYYNQHISLREIPKPIVSFSANKGKQGN